MKRWTIAGLTTLLISLSFALPAAADVPTSIDWGQALKGGAIAAGLWIVANLLGHLWIRSRKARDRRSKE
jgi:hypothetical protein